MIKEYKLRPTQQTLLLEIVKRLKTRDNTSLIAGTGIGKTIMTANLIAYYACVFNPTIDASFNPAAWVRAPKARQIVFIVHLDNLVEQTAIKFRDVFLSRYHYGNKARERNLDKAITYIKSGLPYDATKPIVIASLQTLGNKYEQYINNQWLNPAMLIFDECHTTAFCETGRKLIDEVKYEKRLGLTATPFRLEKDVSFSDLWTDCVVSPSFGDLVKTGELCPVSYKMFESASELKSLKKSKNGDFNQKQTAIKFNTPQRIRFAIDKWEREAREKKTIVFSIDVNHGEAIKNEFVSRGYNAEIISYKLDKKDRNPIYQEFATGKVQILISVKALAVGFDEPSCECGVDLQPTTSISNHWQKIGRIARLHPGKSHALWLDFVGNIENLGLFGVPDNVRMTEDIVLGKKKFKNAEGTAPVKVCPECNTINHASVKHCSECEYEFPKFEDDSLPDGDLVDIVTQAMVSNDDYAKKFYRSLRHKCYIKNIHPNHAYAEYLSMTNISEKYPIPHPKERIEHKEWSKGAICNPSSYEEGLVFLDKIVKIVKKSHKDKSKHRIIIDSALWLEFDDDVYAKLSLEYDKNYVSKKDYVVTLLVS